MLRLGRPSESGAWEWWPSVVGLSLGLGALAWWALRDLRQPERDRVRFLALAGVALLGLACLAGGPGLLAGFGLLVLGRASARRSVEVLGLAALPLFLFLYYHDLEARGHGSRWTVKRKVAAGILPPPRDLGDGRPRWFDDELDAHVRARATAWKPQGVGPAHPGLARGAADCFTGRRDHG